MEELLEDYIEQLKTVQYLYQVRGIMTTGVDTNLLLIAICKTGRFDLLDDSIVNPIPRDVESFRMLVLFLLDSYGALLDLREKDFKFPEDAYDYALEVVRETNEPYMLYRFFDQFFDNKEKLEEFIKRHEDYIREYVRQGHGNLINDVLKDSDFFTKLLLSEKKIDVIRNPEKLSVENLKIMAEALKGRIEVFYIFGSEALARHVLELKTELEPWEVCILLGLLVEKTTYEMNWETYDKEGFTHLVENNIDYLMEMVTKVGIIPKCLIESFTFRDECIKRKRFDLAVQCILPKGFFQNDELVEAYANVLGLESKDLLERGKWVVEYCKKNNDIFNTILGTSLRDGIFNLNEEHYERFVNDIDMQIDIARLNSKELAIFSRIINEYNYKDFDSSSLIVNVVKNIKDYKELIESLDLELLSREDLKALVAVIQLPFNVYGINNIDDLRNYKAIKKDYLIRNFNSNDLDTNKGNILKYLFNIDLDEARFINTDYCTDRYGNKILDRLSNSELPKDIYNYLLIINKIVECEDETVLSILFSQVQSAISYDKEIPLEPYLRSRYALLYAKTLYQPEIKDSSSERQDYTSEKVSYGGKEVRIIIPRERFNFLVHCLGSCSLAEDVYDKDYSVDWLDRPQVRDHIVACSYISEKGIHSIRSKGSIILGFNALEGGSILGMGWTDIDSLGRTNTLYSVSGELQRNNRDRSRYFVPSELLRATGTGYNEIVIERRNTGREGQQQFKRKPDYIIMMADSMEPSNFATLDTIYRSYLPFITEEDKEAILKIGTESDLLKFLIKYKDPISRKAALIDETPKNLAIKFTKAIMKAKYYEDCLKAASEFGIPLVVVDKTYYFHKMLQESQVYDEATKTRIANYFESANERDRANIYRMVATGESPEKIFGKPVTEVSVSL